MIRFINASLQRGTRLLFHSADVTLHQGQRVGLTGANGTGKSSLLAVLRSELQLDAGELLMPPNLEIAHVKQETPAVERSAIDYVLDGDEPLRALQKRIDEAETEDLAALYADYEAIDGYTAQSRAARLLHGLGFQESEISRAVSSFSGGWRMRLNLAQALMCRSDLLLLDEPTNHLDLEAVIWLEQWLQQYQGTLILISHDREFLDRVINQIWHLERETITSYSGNYSDFEKRRAEQLAQQQAAFEKQQKEIAHLQKYIDRFRAKATKARQAQSRVKALERMELISAAHVDSAFSFEFPQAARTGDPMLELKQASIGYADKPVVENINFQLRPGSRIGLLGPNGAGKSTLIKTLAGQLPMLTGERIEGAGLNIGYFAQHQVDQLELDESPLTQFQRKSPGSSEQVLRNHLGGFGFHGDRVIEIVRPFSGGEKSRLALAMMVWMRPNLLVLDEPTNHLDLEMRLALTMALQEFDGAMVVVSHDRHLLRTCTDELFLVHAGRCTSFNGDLDDYRKTISDSQKTELTPELIPDKKTGKKTQRQDAASQRKKSQPLRSRIKAIDKKLDHLRPRQAALEEQLSGTEIYLPEKQSQLQACLQEKHELDKQVLELEEQWLDASEALEKL
ncbi:MAG: ATP-binding cassette domain-containing protein [Thiotrichales bacterium]